MDDFFAHAESLIPEVEEIGGIDVLWQFMGDFETEEEVRIPAAESPPNAIRLAELNLLERAGEVYKITPLGGALLGIYETKMLIP